mgnify:FL=1|jgi:hypothetical protein
MNDTKFWDKLRGKIYAGKGGWVPGEAVYSHGYSVMDDFIGRKSFFQVLILNVTGKMVEQRLADWIENTFIGVSWPDSRIWCNQIGSLGGALQASPVASVCAGVLATDSHAYGSAPFLAAVPSIVEALSKKKNGILPEEIVKAYSSSPGSPPVIVGYARPVARGDERIPAMERVTKQLGFEIGEHLALAYEISEVLLNKYNESMNIVGYIAAFLSDRGFSDKEIYRIYSMCVNSGVHGCYVESYEQVPESFFPLHCEDIDYQGKSSRPVPKVG